jgi:signal transduction histidine kinase
LASGDVEPRREPLDLGVVVTELLATRDATDHRVVVEVEPTPVAADRTMLERVVDNLVRNAQRHTPPGTTIWVRTGSEPDRATLTVEDDGPGVPGDMHERVFEPFQQAPDRQAAPSPGTGIGLALVERFVALHGGGVQLDDRPGGGARFRLWLPTGEETSR